MNQYVGNDQELELQGLEYAQQHILTLTGVTEDFVLEFKHSSDPEWRIYPGIERVGAVNVIPFRAISNTMRVRFLGVPAADYQCSSLARVEPPY